MTESLKLYGDQYYADGRKLYDAGYAYRYLI